MQFDGHSLTCNGNGKSGREYSHQCNELPDGQPVPVLLYQIDFNPRDGGLPKGKKGQWHRQKYTLLGTYYDAKCKGMIL